MDDFYKAAILGAVEGLTEFLPVSSTGHLILVGDALQFVRARSASFEIFIQTGAILAVVMLYFRRFQALIPRTTSVQFDPHSFDGMAGLLKIALACAPAFILGFLFHRQIKEQLFSPIPVAIAFIVGALLILVVESRAQHSKFVALEQLPFKTCFLIGLFQCLALWPGMSRSGATIIGAMLLGVERRAAAEFSFLVAVPVLCAAAGFDLIKGWSMLTAEDLRLFIVGFFVSFVAAALAIRTFLGFLSRFTLRPFAYYRIVVGVVVLWCALT